MKFRKGDKVSVSGVVEYDHDGSNDVLFFKIPGTYQSIGLTPDQWANAGVKLEEPNFVVGDRVTWTDGTGSGEILSLNEGHAWIGMGGGDYCTRMVSTIQRDPDFEEVRS